MLLEHFLRLVPRHADFAACQINWRIQALREGRRDLGSIRGESILELAAMLSPPTGGPQGLVSTEKRCICHAYRKARPNEIISKDVDVDGLIQGIADQLTKAATGEICDEATLDYLQDFCFAISDSAIRIRHYLFGSGSLVLRRLVA